MSGGHCNNTMQANHPEGGNSFARKCIHALTVGTALAAGAVILAPYVLPLVGIGEEDAVVNIMSKLHSNPAIAGKGLAGLINQGLGAIPLIGETLAKGDITTALASGVIGVGGMLLGRYVGKRENGSHYIKWGKVITTAALVASALIAMPTVLTGVTAGITFLAERVNNEVASTALTFLIKTIGFSNSASLTAASASTATIALPHLLTCGAGALPAFFSYKEHCRHKARHEQIMRQEADPVALESSAGDVTATIKLNKPTQAFEPVSGVVQLRDVTTGKPLTEADLKTTHTRKVHLLIVDSSLKDYHHIHPVATGTPGEYAFSFTPKTSNAYDGWSDITLIRDGRNYQVKSCIPSELHRKVPAIVKTNSQAEQSALRFDWQADKPLASGQTTQVTVKVSDQQGKPINDLEPVMGAYAHLVGFSADGKSMIHTHPMGAEPTSEACRGGPALRFKITPETDGKTQFYLQIRRNGEEIYVPFGQNILPPARENSTTQNSRLWMQAVRNSPSTCAGMA